MKINFMSLFAKKLQTVSTEIDQIKAATTREEMRIHANRAAVTVRMLLEIVEESDMDERTANETEIALLEYLRDTWQEAAVWYSYHAEPQRAFAAFNQRDELSAEIKAMQADM